MMASSQLADARVEAKVLQDMLGKANLATDKATQELETIKRSLRREETMRAESNRVSKTHEDRIKELESRLSHDRQIVKDTNTSRESDKMKLMDEMEEERKNQEAIVEKLTEQAHSLRSQLRDAKLTPSTADIKIQEARDEVEQEAKAKTQKAVAAEKRKGDRAYAMLKEDYDDLVHQKEDLQKTMRDRIRHIEQSTAEQTAHGTKASEQLKMRDSEVRRMEQEVTTLNVECSGLRAKLDSTVAGNRANKERSEGEREASVLALQTAQVDLAAARVDLKSYKKKLRNSKDKRQAIEGELTTLKLDSTAKIEELTVDCTVAKAELEKVSSTSEAQAEKILTLTAENKNLSIDLKATKADLEKSNKDLSVAEEGLQDAIATNETLTNTKQTLETQLEDTKSALETTQRALEQAVSEIRTVGFQTESFEHQLSAAVTALKKIANTKAKKPASKKTKPSSISTEAASPTQPKTSSADVNHSDSDTDGEKKKGEKMKATTKKKKKTKSSNIFGESGSDSSSSDDEASTPPTTSKTTVSNAPRPYAVVTSTTPKSESKNSDSDSDSSSSDSDSDSDSDDDDDAGDKKTSVANVTSGQADSKASDSDGNADKDDKEDGDDDEDGKDGEKADATSEEPKVEDVVGDAGLAPTAIVQNAIAALRSRLSATQQRVSQITAETNASTQRVKDVEKVLTMTKQSEVKLTQQKSSLEAELETEIAELRSTQKTLTETQEREAKTNDILTTTTSSLDSTAAEFETTSAKLTETTETLRDTSEKLAKVSAEFDENDMALKATNELLTKTTAELKDATSRADEGETALAELSDEFDKIKTAASSALDLLSTTRDDLQTTQTNLEDVTQAKAALDAKFETLTTEHDDAKEQLTVLEATQADLDESQDFVRSLTKQLDEGAEEREQLEQKVKESTLNVERATAAADTKDKLFMQNSEKLYGINQDLADKSALCETNQTQVTSLTARVKELEGNDVMTTAECNALSMTLKDVRGELATTKALLDGEREKHTETEGKLNVELQCGIKLTMLLAKSENSINQLTETIQNMETQSSQSSLEKEALKIGVKDLDSAKRSATDAVVVTERIQAELSAITSERDELKKELEEVQDVKDELQRKATATERLVSSISVEKLRFATEAQKLQKKLDVMQQERSSIEDGLSVTTAKLGAIEHTPDDLFTARNRIVELEVELASTKESLDELHRKHNAAEKLVSSVSVEKLKLQAKLDRLAASGGNEFKESKDQKLKRAKERSELVEKVVSTFGCDVRLYEITRESPSTSLGIEVSANHEGQVQITNVDEGSPTHGKLAEGDVIVSVNGTFLLDSPYDDVVGSLIEAGTVCFIAVATNESVSHLVPDS